MDQRTVGMKNPGRCGEVAVIERWPLVEDRLYSNRASLKKSNQSKR